MPAQKQPDPASGGGAFLVGRGRQLARTVAFLDGARADGESLPMVGEEHCRFLLTPQQAGVALVLTGRRAECDALDRLAAAVRTEGSRALVVCGEPGSGKSALLEYLAGRAPGCRVIRATGIQSEMELAFAAMHQLCAPVLDHLERVPDPQQDALRTVFGMNAGPAPDRFLVGLAVLSLLSAVAERQPVICLIDDQQWLDQASAQVLAFVARRLGTESVGLVFGTRMPGGALAGLPELAVGGLREADARELLEAALTGPVDERVRDQIVAETHGNPLALLGMPRGLPSAELAGGFGLPGALHLSDTLEDGFRPRIAALPAETRRLLVLAAADPIGDLGLLWRAAGRLGIGAEAAEPAVEAGLAEFGIRVRFLHPLVRSAVYRCAPVQERRQAHAALAEVIDPRTDPARRAWHRALAAPGPDEDVAAELERSVGRARARGGMAAAAAFLERAAMLTPDPARRAGRALGAANTKIQAGAFDAAQDLLTMAVAGPLSEFERARADLLRAQLVFVGSRRGDAPLLLVKAAKRFEPIDAGLARATYLDALTASTFAGRLASPGGHTLEVARAARAAPRPLHAPGVPDLLLDGLAANFSEGYAAGVPFLRRALAAFGGGMSADQELRWLWLTTLAALHLWDDERWDVLSARYVELARKAGALSELPLALTTRSMMLLFAGDLTAVTSLTDEGRAVREATGSRFAPYAAIGLAALQGNRDKVCALTEATANDVALHGEGIAMSFAGWANAVLHNGLGRYREAVPAAHQALYCQEYPDMHYPGIASWAAAELVEAAARSGMTEVAARSCRWLAEMTSASGTCWALGVETRSRALLTEGDVAEGLYQESITHLGRSRVRAELARAHLLYGEWLRRQRRRGEAREQLRTAHEMLEAAGMKAFAERARRELRATGETARKRAAALGDQQLTAQESQIARLASDGMSNPEIGAQLSLSPRTIQYHLGNVFAKFGITSRSQLSFVLPVG
jgi:DNA-binding CsgD family transcriptional regulator